MLPDFDTCYRAVSSRDPRFDGRFFTGVRTTGIYCRPICPAQTPKAQNVRFYGSAAAAVAAGFRACRRCRPDTVPGSRQWDARADLAGRALRLIAAGAADGDGVGAVATQLHVSERHLHRLLTDEVGAGPQALARTRRAQTARLLLDETDLPMAEVAFAAGYASVRQFNDSIREEFGAAPTNLRATRNGASALPADPGSITLRLRHREPYDTAVVLDFVRARAVPGMEHVDGDTVARTIRAAHGPAVVEVTPGAGALHARLTPRSLADVPQLVATIRRWYDLDADPAAVNELLGPDPILAPSVRSRPGMRVPASVDGFELTVRAILGQRISIASARAALARIVAEHGEPVDTGHPELTTLFPRPEVLADAPLPQLPARLASSIRAVAGAVATGELCLDPGTDRPATAAQLLAIPGIGPWTVDYVAMRGWGDPDAFPATDLILKRVVAHHGVDPQRWRPWRAYAAMHLWNLPDPTKERRS